VKFVDAVIVTAKIKRMKEMTEKPTVVETISDELTAAFHKLIEHNEQLDAAEELTEILAEKEWLIGAGWNPDQSNLPASAFAIPRPNETPKGKLPHHSPDGKPSKDGVSAALKRLHQTNASSEELAKAKSHLCSHVKELGMNSSLCD
jgi:hypothetical protein